MQSNGFFITRSILLPVIHCFVGVKFRGEDICFVKYLDIYCF